MSERRYLRRSFLAGTGAAGLASLVGTLGTATADSTVAAQQTASAEQDPDVETVAADPTDVPDPVDWTEPRHHEIELETREVVAEIEPGVTHRFLTFEGQIPGPMIRVRRGDTVHGTLRVPEEYNVHPHNVDFHAVYGPGGGADATTLAPGDGPASFEFRAEYPGAFVYHCAPGRHDYHVSTGMFGAIVVEPADGLPDVDREFYIGQHELYTDGEAGEAGHHAWDADAAKRADPTYVPFNGEAGRFTDGGEHGPLHAEVGEAVRVFWANGGPNLVSTPHPIGNVFRRWFANGDLVSEPRRWVESSTLGPGAVAVGDLDLRVPGRIDLVDHALSRVVHKGTGARIQVEGELDEDVFDPSPSVPAACRHTATVDGQTVCDLDGDGHYRDLTASGDVTTQDLQVFFENQHREPWDSRTDLFDFTNDGNVGQPDVVALFEAL